MAMGSAEHNAKVDGFSDLREQRQYTAGKAEILVARHSGYCWGVQRAYDQTLAAAASGDEKVTTFGPLIHNPQTIADLRDTYNVDYVEKAEDVNEGTVIVRTHGVPLQTKQALEQKGLNVIDATCPYVRVSQNYAKLLHDERYFVVIIGSPDHPEVKGIMSYTEGQAVVVKKKEDLAQIPKTKRRLGVVIQSTMILDHANELIAELIRMGQEVRVFNTICYVTDERQIDAEEVASKSEFVVVVGGKESSNTKKLAVVAQEQGARTQLIQGTAELDFEEFGDATRIGVLAGASTPNWLIDDVIAKISEHYESK